MSFFGMKMQFHLGFRIIINEFLLDTFQTEFSREYLIQFDFNNYMVYCLSQREIVISPLSSIMHVCMDNIAEIIQY